MTEVPAPDARWRAHADRSRELLDAAASLARVAQGAPILVSDDAPTGVIVPIVQVARLIDICEQIERAGEQAAAVKQL